MTDSLVQDFPFVSDLPKREQKKVSSVWDELEIIASLVKENGPPVPHSMCALALGVSKQRIYQLVESGRLKTMEYGGQKHVSRNSLYEFATQERKAGRPVGWRKYPDNEK